MRLKYSKRVKRHVLTNYLIIMKTLIKKWKQKYGYEPTLNELYSHYTQGYLILTDKEENELLSKFN